MIERVVRLVRSKGVGVYFVTQIPQDIPEDKGPAWASGAACPAPSRPSAIRKAVRVTAETFRQNDSIEIESVITQLAVGEALVSVLHRCRRSR